MRPHNALHNHQAQTGAFLLRRIKRFEDAVDLLLRNAAARVRHAHPDAFARFARLQSQPPPVVIACIAFFTRFTKTCCNCVGVNGYRG